ncbi:MAG: M60 family metallopeptidase [Planctomycetes bacterium]|nr:M60 family metallopeptidase [Planctomycetota bacterium]
MSVRFAWSAFVAGVVVLAAPVVAQERGDLEALLDGVRSIAAPGIPGALAVFGDRAFPVVVGRVDEVRLGAAVAAARVESGRVVVFGHSGYASTDALRAGDTTILVRNAVKWLAPKLEHPRIGAVGGWAAALRVAGFTPRELHGRDAYAALDQVDVVATPLLSLSDEEMQRVAEFVERGGALLGADTGWGWQQLAEHERLETQPIQRWLALHGLAFTTAYVERTSEVGFTVEGAPARTWNGEHALDLLVASASKTKTSAAELADAAWAVSFAARAQPDVETPFGARLGRLVREHEREIAATDAKPLGADRPLLRALAAAQSLKLARTAPDSTRAHPAAADFPGAVTADSVMQSLDVDTSIGGWHSTGLWANPGARVAVQLGTEAVAAGLAVRIGCHADELWPDETWRRMPAITREFALDAASTTAANAFGGLVYVVVPPNCKAGRVRLVVRGAIPAPYFELGTTSNEDWRTIRKRPGPWAELASRRLVITVPSRVIRELDDPKSLMVFWDRVLDAQAELAAIPSARATPERFVLDRQISVGYMHSGYPIMAHLDVAELVVDRERLATGAEIWGFVHELGHNLQVEDWTFEGTDEVTNNLFALYAIEKTCELAPGHHGHEHVDTPPSLEAHLASGAKFENWSADPFLALQTYLKVRDAFGWEPFRAVFAQYVVLADAERPKSDAEKRDQWIVRLSRAVGRNLAPYFEAWGVAPSEDARRSLAELPPWMPEDWPKR